MTRAKPLASKLGGESPEFQRGVEFALRQLFGQQRRRAEDRRGLRLEIDALLERPGLQHQPALVERAAGDAELLADEVGRLSTGADAASLAITAPSAGRMGIEHQLAFRARARARPTASRTG